MLLLAAIAAWAHLAKPMPPLDGAEARRRLTDEFPGKALDCIWISDDGRGAVARSGGLALILYAVGDGYVARDLPWDQVAASPVQDGCLALKLHDMAAPRAKLAFATWPLN